MSRSLTLVRHCSGICTRIECEIRPLAGECGLWVLLCAAGMSDAQPSAIKAQGPFYGPCVAEDLLAAVASSLELQGYVSSDDPPIWCLHLQAELRRMNAERCSNPGDFQSSPDH